jgi:ubiquinone/menaquinone biosynthesis C-methylase UbiE
LGDLAPQPALGPFCGRQIKAATQKLCGKSKRGILAKMTKTKPLVGRGVGPDQVVSSPNPDSANIVAQEHHPIKWVALFLCSESEDTGIVNIFKQTLGSIVGGRVLDVATQEGGFVQILTESLKSYTEIVGIDISEHAIKVAQSTFDQENVQFIQMDAEQLSFEDKSFDTVSISASLHHLANISPVLTEMKRVLKLGGRFIIAEMHREGQTEAQLTVVYLHHWVAEVDSALGQVHNSTLARQEFVDYVESLGLCNVELGDFSDTDSDPMDEIRIEQLEGLIDRNIQRAEVVSNYKRLKRRGEELRRRLYEVGAQREPVLIVIGEKR